MIDWSARVSVALPCQVRVKVVVEESEVYEASRLASASGEAAFPVLGIHSVSSRNVCILLEDFK